MIAKDINIYCLYPYIAIAFEGDNELLNFYDTSENINSIEEAVWNVYKKIKGNYPNAIIRGVEEEDKKIGYFVYEEDLLISFSINKAYRNADKLKDFFSLIKSCFPHSFLCYLYGHNGRAIGFLEKGGMKKLAENVTILYH